MAGLNHDFLLLSEKEHPVSDYMKFINHPNAVLIHDDILQYIADTLKWIESFNPAIRKCPSYCGLCWYGPTIIRKNGAGKLHNIFNLWADLFAHAPADLELTGNFSFVVDNDPVKEGYTRIVPGTEKHEKLILNRDEVVEKLRAVANYADKVLHSNDLYILHLGI